MFAHAARLLGGDGRWVPEPGRLRLLLVLGPLTAAPIALYLAVGEPVGLLKLAGVIEALHLPGVAGFALLLGRRLPAELRPRWWTSAATMVAALFFSAFAIVYLLQTVTGG